MALANTGAELRLPLGNLRGRGVDLEHQVGLPDVAVVLADHPLFISKDEAVQDQHVTRADRIPGSDLLMSISY